MVDRSTQSSRPTTSRRAWPVRVACSAETSKSVEIGTTTQANGGIHGDLVAAMSLLVNDSKKLTGFALDDTFEPILWGATDLNGRPLYTELPTDDVAQGLARPGRLLN